MVVKIYDNKIVKCGVGISTPKDANVEIGTNDFQDCGIAIELRDPPSFLESVGLMPDTPIEKVVAILKSIDKGDIDDKNLESEMEKRGLFEYLSAGANVSTLVSALVQLSTSDQIQQVLSLLSK